MSIHVYFNYKVVQEDDLNLFNAVIDSYFQWINKLLIKLFRVEVPEKKEDRTTNHYITLGFFHLSSTILGMLIPGMAVIALMTMFYSIAN